MTLQLSLAPLTAEPKQFSVGDTIKVTVKITYAVSQDTAVTLKAGPYQYTLGVLDRIGSCFGETSVSLGKAITPVEKTASVDFYLKPKAEGGIADGTYGLIVEIPEADASAKLDDVLIIGGNPVGITDLLPMLIVVMMMGMIMPMMEEV